MPPPFSLSLRRSRFAGDYSFVVAQSLENARVAHLVGSSAATGPLGLAIVGVLLKMDREARELLERFRPWLVEALSKREWMSRRNGSEADEARWSESLALYDWLLYGRQNTDALDLANEHWFRWYTSEEGAKLRGEIGSLFALAIDGGRYEQIVNLYARPLKRPLKPTSATSEAGFGNYLAHYLRQSSGLDAAVEGSFDSFLFTNMQEQWLGRGQFPTAIHWLKLRFWNFADPKPEPFAVVRRALDYLPEEARQLPPG